jgi:uncharacterized membrane protein (UPF0127 family)
VSVTRGTLTLRREDGRVVCESVGVADSTLRRLRGLLGRRGLRDGEGIVLRPAWSIHTAFMRFPIDVVFLDHDQVVLRIERALRPFRTASCRGAREIVELGADECTRRGLEAGDRVTWAPRAAFDEGASSENALPRAERHGSVIVASDDHRFAKLARFLLDSHGIGVSRTVAPDRLVGALDDRPDVVVLDAGERLASTLRIANAARARRPQTAIVMVGEGAAERAPAGIRIYHKWDETDDAVSAVEEALASR